MKDTGATTCFLERQLWLFEQRCSEIVERVDAGLIGFIEGVDMAYSAAVWSGLTDNVGDDAVQMVMARAFRQHGCGGRHG
jgi:hypothetical protein